MNGFAHPSAATTILVLGCPFRVCVLTILVFLPRSALAGLRGKKNVEVFVLHPHGRVSHIQEKQMTTITDPNVHNISGTPAGCFPASGVARFHNAALRPTTSRGHF